MSERMVMHAGEAVAVRDGVVVANTDHPLAARRAQLVAAARESFPDEDDYVLAVTAILAAAQLPAGLPVWLRKALSV